MISSHSLTVYSQIRISARRTLTKGAAYCFGRWYDRERFAVARRTGMSRPINNALWQQLTQDVTAAMGAWRLAHPTATLREIEVELDPRLNRMRARLLS